MVDLKTRTREPLDDPVLKQLLLEHVQPVLKTIYPSISYLGCRGLTTAQSPLNRYVLSVIFADDKGVYDRRLIINKKGEVTNLKWKI